MIPLGPFGFYLARTMHKGNDFNRHQTIISSRNYGKKFSRKYVDWIIEYNFILQQYKQLYLVGVIILGADNKTKEMSIEVPVKVRFAT